MQIVIAVGVAIVPESQFEMHGAECGVKKCRQICYIYTETISRPNYNPKPSNCSEQSSRRLDCAIVLSS